MTNLVILFLFTSACGVARAKDHQVDADAGPTSTTDASPRPVDANDRVDAVRRTPLDAAVDSADGSQ